MNGRIYPCAAGVVGFSRALCTQSSMHGRAKVKCQWNSELEMVYVPTDPRQCFYMRPKCHRSRLVVLLALRPLAGRRWTAIGVYWDSNIPWQGFHRGWKRGERAMGVMCGDGDGGAGRKRTERTCWRGQGDSNSDSSANSAGPLRAPSPLTRSQRPL